MFDLQAHLSERRAAIDAALEKVLPAADARPALLHQAMRHAVFSGGKRVRPILTLDAARSVGGRDEDAMPAALAVEILHTYTLVHDDLPAMDDDDFRRGKPTCHKVYGEANAILAGDALQALAFEILAGAAAPASCSVAGMVRELATAAGSVGVVGGQVEDLAAADRPDAATVEFIHLHKTADLFRCAVRLGAMSGGATATELARLTEYATGLGLAFQITDDVLDEEAPADPGKPASKPELTCLAVYTRDEALAKAGALIAGSVAALSALRRGPVEPLRALAEFILQRTC